MPTETKKTSGRGCLLYGCLSLVVLVIVLLVGGYLTARYVVNTAIENYTDDTSIQFEEIVMSDADREALKNRINEFNQARGKTNQPVELALTGDEVNVLISEAKSKHVLAEKIRISIEDDKLIARASVPLEEFSKLPLLSRLKDRHLNANVNVGIALEEGVAALSIASAEVNGQPLPQEIIDAIEREMAVKDVMNDPEIRNQLNQLDWIRVEDGKLRIATGGSE